MQVCLIAEGSYPYVKGGVAQWVQDLILGLPDINFSILSISARPKTQKDFLYKLPKNVLEVKNISLDLKTFPNVLRNKIFRKRKTPSSWKIINTFYRQMEADDYSLLKDIISLVDKGSVSLENFFLSRQGWDLMLRYYKKQAPIVPLVEFYWLWRSIHLPLLKLLFFDVVPQADIYHAISTGYAGFLGAVSKLRYNKRLLLTEHGLYTQERDLEINYIAWLKSCEKDVFSLVFRRLGKIAYLLADKIISLYADAATMQVELGAPKEKIEIIPNGVDVESFAQINRISRSNKYNIGFVGRVVPIKDVKSFIFMAKTINSQIPEADFYIIGPCDEDEAYFQECKTLVESLNLENNVFFTGKVETKEYYPLLDVLVLPSIKEAQPLVVLEAMAAGVPVVATKTGSIPEILGNDFGIVVLPKDVQAMSNAVMRFLKNQDYTRNLTIKAREKILHEYDFKKILERYKALYKQLS